MDQNTDKKENDVEITGNIGEGGVKIKELSDNKKVGHFSLAEDVDGRTKWHNVQVWDENADKAKDYSQGDLISVKGYSKSETYTAKSGENEGKEVTKDVVVGKEVEMISAKADRVTVKGNVVEDVKVKEVGEGNHKLAAFSVAENKEGEETKFHNVEMWRDKAEIAGEFKKGDFVEIKGSIKVEKYVAKSGENEGKEMEGEKLIGSSATMIQTAAARAEGKEETADKGASAEAAPAVEPAKEEKKSGMSM